MTKTAMFMQHTFHTGP